MAKTPAEIRFETARKNLSESLKNLEKTVKEKFHQAVIDAKMLDIAGDHGDEQALTQSTIIQNLNHEINKLQKNLSDLGKETEFLNEQNKVLSKKITETRTEKNSLVKSIEADLLRIEEIINEE